MSVVYERIYIRFKGRVLGPLPHDKVVELVARGQITRDQEMSSDAVNWNKASEFTSFFPPVQVNQVIQASAVAEPSARVTETWFLNIDGEDATKPYDEATIKQLIAAGTVQSSTPLWNQETGAWQDAGAFRPQWFVQVERDASAKSSVDNGEVNLETIGGLLVSPRRWLSVLAVAGIIMSTIVLLTSLGGFFASIVGNAATGLKICLVIASAGQAVACVGWLYVCAKLIGYISRLTAIKFRPQSTEVQAAVSAHSSLAAVVTLVFAFWACITLVGVLSVVAAWQLQTPVMDEELTLRWPITIQFNAI